MIRYIVLLLFITSFARAQNETKIPIDNFPDLHSVWNTDDYSAVLKILKTAQATGTPLPSLADPYYTTFFARLTSDDNLKRFADTSIPQAQRLQEAQPFTQVIPDIVTLFTNAGMDNEMVAMALFTMKATARFISTLNEIVPCADGPRREELFSKMRKNNGLFMVLDGGLDILKAGPGSKIEPRYLVSLAGWYAENLPPLMEWLTPEHQKECRDNISRLAKKKTLPEVKADMKQTLAALDAYKPKPHASFASIMKANELTDTQYKNTILGLAISAPGDWIGLSQKKATTDTVTNNAPEETDQNMKRLLYLHKDTTHNDFSPTLIVSIENIECTGITEATPYLRQIQTLLSQTQNIVYSFGFMSTTSVNNHDFAMLDSHVGTTGLKQDYMVTVLQGKYALVYIATYIQPADGEALRTLVSNTIFSTGDPKR